FKAQLAVAAAMAAYPLLYVAARASPPPLRYLTVLSIPVCVGVALTAHFMLTARSYERFAKRAGYVLSAVFIALDFMIASYYRQAFGKSILSDLETLLPLMAGQVLAFLFFVPLAAVRRYVIVLEDASGRRCAVVAASEEDAKLLVELVARRAMAHA
ncbi:MAG: hypothetical protein DRJ56_08045, partial [Thermoprotei archaeon]